MLLDATFQCSFCGEEIETTVDVSGGRRQIYTEDCQVCCRPNVLHVSVEPEGAMLAACINAEPESDPD